MWEGSRLHPGPRVGQSFRHLRKKVCRCFERRRKLSQPLLPNAFVLIRAPGQRIVLRLEKAEKAHRCSSDPNERTADSSVLLKRFPTPPFLFDRKKAVRFRSPTGYPLCWLAMPDPLDPKARKHRSKL